MLILIPTIYLWNDNDSKSLQFIQTAAVKVLAGTRKREYIWRLFIGSL